MFRNQNCLFKETLILKLNTCHEVGLQNVVFKYYCPLKIHKNSLENWLIPDLGHKMYKKHLGHLDILEKIYQRLQMFRSQSESAPDGKRCENVRIKGTLTAMN